MKLTDIFVRRPVLAIVVNLVILLLGLASVNRLNVRQYPKSDVSVITVSTAYVGASADLVRGFVTTPLERAIASADGIDYIESSSSAGVSTISAHLVLNYDPTEALTQVTSKVNQVRNDLPPEAEIPVINITTPDDQRASMYLGFSSDEMAPNEITDYLVRVIQPQLSSIPGVQRADILGARTYAMRVWLMPDKMAALGLSPTDVRTALQANNYLAALGSTKGEMVSIALTANTNLQSVDEFANLVLRQQGDTITRLRDVARVELGAESYDNEVRFDGKDATFMGIWVLPTANALDVIADVRELIPQMRANLPPGLTVDVPYDATAYINDAIEEITGTLLETLGIVIIVIFLFLGSVRSVLIPVMAMPLSLLGAAFMMYVFGFTINLLTLLAIVLSVGIVVDDAIVVLENVERHIRMGKKRIRAAMDAARELVGPVIAMTITLLAVYAPIGFQGGLTGALFREFAFTLAGAVTVSGFVALTLSPMMASRILKEEHAPKGFAAMIDHHFDWLRRTYNSALRWVLRYNFPVVLAALLLTLLFPAFYLFTGKELAPAEDQGVIFGIINGSPSSSLEQSLLYTDKIYDIYDSQPETEHIFQITMPGGGFAGLVTKPWSERERTTQEMLGQINGTLSAIPGVEVFAVTPPPLPGGSNFPVEFVIASTASPQEIRPIAQEILARAMQSGKFMFARTDLHFDRPETEVIIDRDKAAAMGLDMRKVGADLGAALGGNYVNRFSIEGRSYKVIPQITRSQRLTQDQLGDIYVTGPGSSLIPLSSIATLETTAQPRELKRFQQLNAAVIQGAPMPGTTLSDALAFLEEQAAELFPQGRGFRVDYAGESRQLRSEGGAGNMLLLFSLAMIFLVLAAQFESFRSPLIILAGSVPLALTGALLFPFLGFTTINIYSQVGLVTLVGLIAKNGILIVEFANSLQKERKLNKFDAVIEAASIRLRPILMTSAATIFGHMPLIFVTGAGAHARNSIGLVIVTGMFIGSMFTLFVVPSIYLLLGANLNKETAEEREAGPEGALPANA